MVLSGPALTLQTPHPLPFAAGQTLAQFETRQEMQIMAADSDGDGRVSLAEFEAAAKAKKTDPAKRFRRIDANQDGFLDKTEIDTMFSRRFHRLDRDGDGIVTGEERMAAHRAQRGSAKPGE